MTEQLVPMVEYMNALTETEQWQDLAKKLAMLAINNAGAETQTGVVSRHTYDSMADIYDAFLMVDPEIADYALGARWLIRLSNQGTDYPMHDFDIKEG